MFVIQLSAVVTRRMAAHLPEDVVLSIRGVVEGEDFHRILWDIRSDWIAQVGPKHANKKNAVLVAVLIANLIGPLNRIEISPGIDRAKLIYAFLSFMANMLERDVLSDRLAILSERIMLVA